MSYMLPVTMLRRRRSSGLGSERVLQLFERRGGLAGGVRRALQLLSEQTARHHQEQAVRIRCEKTYLCEYFSVCFYQKII